MKAITISQPFASLIADGEKWVENRTWATDYRGPIAIHAGKGQQYLDAQELQEYPTGCIVAVAILSACFHIDEIHKQQFDKTVPGTWLTFGQVQTHEHTEGPFCWILELVKKLDHPIVAKGQQGLWDCYISNHKVIAK